MMPCVVKVSKVRSMVGSEKEAFRASVDLLRTEEDNMRQMTAEECNSQLIV